MKYLATLLLTTLAIVATTEIHTPLGMLGLMTAGAGFGVVILLSEVKNNKMYY